MTRKPRHAAAPSRTNRFSPGNKPAARSTAGRRDRTSYARTHAEIIEATIGSIVGRGLSGTTVQSIADEAGVSTATVIKHFKTKEGVLDAVIASLAAEFETARRRITAEAGGDPVRCLNLLLDLSFHPEVSSDRRIGAWYAYSGEVTSRGFFEKHMRSADRAMHHQVRSIFRRLAKTGGNPEIDPDAAAIGFIGALEWLWQERLLGRRRAWPSSGKKVMQAYLAGVFPNHFPMPR